MNIWSQSKVILKCLILTSVPLVPSVRTPPNLWRCCCWRETVVFSPRVPLCALPTLSSAVSLPGCKVIVWGLNSSTLARLSSQSLESSIHVSLDEGSAAGKAGKRWHQGSAYILYVCIKSFSLRILNLFFVSWVICIWYRNNVALAPYSMERKKMCIWLFLSTTAGGQPEQ